jgi:transcription antitermination protein NusB
MLYRRHLRIKVLQALYAWYTSGSSDLNSGEKQLLLSINKLYELFIWQLSFLVELRRFAGKRIEERKEKFYPTEEDLNPNLKFITNTVGLLLEDNLDFRHKEELYKVNWSQDQELIRNYYEKLEKSDYYRKYMSSKTQNIEEDRLFYIKIVDQLLSREDLLRDFYEEKSVFFVDGYDLVQLLLIKFFETISASFTKEQKMKGLFKGNNQQKNEELDFVKTIYKKVILKEKENEEILKAKTSSWDYDRIPLMDLILLKMAIIELQEMKTVPVKVTLNEYIELARYFSTAKSRTFVNGVLDRLIREFREEGKIVKTGRGLIE